jgi:cation diffusion facilitator family transporter
MDATLHKVRSRGIRRVLAGVLVINWGVAIAKLLYGVVNDSAAVTADGLHSFIDGASNVVGLIAMSIAAQPADDDHPYGHGKFEALASLGIGAMVGIGMLELGRMALDSLLHGHHPIATFEMIGLMAFTLVLNLTVTRDAWVVPFLGLLGYELRLNSRPHEVDGLPFPI